MTTPPLLPPGFIELYVYGNLCIHLSLICTFQEIFYEVCCSQKRMRKTEMGKKHALTRAQGHLYSIPFSKYFHKSVYSTVLYTRNTEYIAYSN